MPHIARQGVAISHRAETRLGQNAGRPQEPRLWKGGKESVYGRGVTSIRTLPPVS